jgi:hypothetical protein
MRLAVSYDEQGNILTLFDPEKLHGDQASTRYAPGTDEKHHVLEVPAQFEDRSFWDLPNLLRVNTAGEHPRFEAKP